MPSNDISFTKPWQRRCRNLRDSSVEYAPEITLLLEIFDLCLKPRTLALLALAVLKI